MTDSPCCSLEPEALKERAAAWRSLGHAVVGGQATPSGAILRYRLEAGVAEALLELLDAERQCCPSLSFGATVDVSIDASEQTRAWVRHTFLAAKPAIRSAEPDLGRKVQEAVGRPMQKRRSGARPAVDTRQAGASTR